MSKSILGDDPFAPADAVKPAAKPKAAEPREKKRPGKRAAKATTPTVPGHLPEPGEEQPPSPEVPPGEPEPDAPEPAPETRAHADVPPGEYGPPLDDDRASPHGLRDVLEHVRALDEQARQRFQGPSRRRVPLALVWKPLRQLAMRDRSDVVDEFGRDPTVAAKMDPLLDFLYQRYFRVDARGLGHIPDDGRALIVSNHSGSLPYDGAMIMQAVRKEHPRARAVRPLVEDFVFHFPYLGTLMNRIGGVRACQENAERLLRDEQLVAVFPEGIKGIGKVFAQRYRLQRFGRGGFIKLALSTDAPIIPTAVVGAEEIHPMLAKITWLSKALGIPYIPITPTFPWLGPVGLLPLPSKWTIAFGEPLYFNTEYGPEAANDRILVNRLAEQVRQRIQEMIDALLAKRSSVLFG